MDGIQPFTQFVAQHKPQLESSGVPQHLWRALHHKISKEVFDAGKVFQLLLIDYEDDDDDEQVEESGTVAPVVEEHRPAFALAITRENGIDVRDSNAIYLIDHAWTFRMNIVRQQLEQHPHLTDRLCAIMGIDLEDAGRNDQVMHRMWSYCHTYSIASSALSDEERQPIWYILDEVGSAINHADEPNFRVVPFIYLDNQITYSLLFPIRDCECGEQVTRNFAEHLPVDTPERDALLLPWRATDLREQSFVQAEPSAEYFSEGHIVESYPTSETDLMPWSGNRILPLKVYTEYEVIRSFLTASEFRLVDNIEDADILWLTHHFKDFAELSRDMSHKFINQFPFEYVITIKDLLSIICRRAAKEHHNAETLETYPKWLPTTYNLKTELPLFVSYFQHRAAKAMDNHWIVKPWNLARGMDTHISNNIKQIVRLPITGPKIAQKYIERPVLFQRDELNAKVKFDIRYVVLVKSVQPLEAYVHRKFFLRFANKPFSLDHFDDYEQHFTVMNYQENAQLRHIKCEDFLEIWKQQYPEHKWTTIEDEICAMLTEVLTCASERAPPCGLAPCPQSRALYAADIMLAWEKATGGKKEEGMQPKLLEVNWTPDCQRACQYYAEFFNDIFKLLFLDVKNDDSFRLLTTD